MNENNNKKNQKNMNLPLIDKDKKSNQLKLNNTNSNKNKDSSTLTSLAKNSIKEKSIEKTTPEKTFSNQKKNKTNSVISNYDNSLSKQSKLKSNKTNISGNKTDDKINDIINSINKQKKINTKLINNSMNDLENNRQKKIIKLKKYKIYKPLNPLLSPHDDMSFINEHKTKENFYKNLAHSMPKMTKEKLNEIKERRIARINREKKKLEHNSLIIMNDIKGENSIIKSGEIVLDNILKSLNTPTKIDHINAQKILEESGMIEAYKQLIKNLCQNGMPEGNVYNYCSEFIKNFERVWQKMKYKKLSKKIEEHFKEKKELYIKNNENNNKNKYFRVLEQREEMQFIKKLDKSRSSLRVIKRINILDSNKNKEAIANNINKKEENKNNSRDIKGFKNHEKKITNKIKLIENRNILSSNKVTFNIALKQHENNEKRKNKKENSKIENIKENLNDKDNFKEKKLIQKMKNKIETENKTIIDNKNNKDDKIIIKKDKKKNKKAKKIEDNMS